MKMFFSLTASSQLEFLTKTERKTLLCRLGKVFLKANQVGIFNGGNSGMNELRKSD